MELAELVCRKVIGLTDENCLRKAGDAIEREGCAFKAANPFTDREKREEKQAGDGCRREEGGL